jgi:hypothetical protein
VSLESRAHACWPDHGGPDALSITEFYNGGSTGPSETSFPEELWITGEIRSIKVLPRGHCFIDLVDPTNAQDSGAPTLNVKCWSTRWRSVRSTLDRLGIVLDSGMVVRVRGEVQFYKARGTVDFILSELDTDALLGKVAAERARLIKALVDEDLFDRSGACPSLRSRSGSAWWPVPTPRAATTSSGASTPQVWPSTSPSLPRCQGKAAPANGWPRPSEPPAEPWT